jgi:hypothetical protein
MRRFKILSGPKVTVIIAMVGACISALIGCVSENPTLPETLFGIGATDPYCPPWFSQWECGQYYDAASALMNTDNETCQLFGEEAWYRMQEGDVGRSTNPNCMPNGGVTAETDWRHGLTDYCSWTFGHWDQLAISMGHEEAHNGGWLDEGMAESWGQGCYDLIIQECSRLRF